MDDFQGQMNAILGNPEMMQKIMAMAQSLGQGADDAQEAPPPNKEPSIAPISEIDLSMIQKLSGLAGQSNIDSNQRTLLKALTPYLKADRIRKLEKAMRAAKLANVASAFLGTAALSFQPGR